MSDETTVARAEFTECDSLTNDDPVQQGDVFEWLGDVEPPWRRFGIVVTADCDLFFAKHSGILSYVPVIPLTEYLTLFHLPKRFEEHRQPVVDELVAAVRKHQVTAHPEFPEPVSEEAVLRWIEGDGTIGMIDQLGVADPERSRMVKLAEDHQCSVKAEATGTFDEQVDALTRLRWHRSKKAAKATWSEISSLVTRLPGDAFFIGALAVGYESGYVAYLRLVRDVRQDEVAIRQTDLGRESAKARRIARLRPPFIHALTQQLGAVFSSIGLPARYEDNRSRLVSILAAGRGGE